ncbi:hypothetical protein H4S14_003255 [Agrobacterium vitis]|nr:hypothetical protein [Agrobacterium vitis]
MLADQQAASTHGLEVKGAIQLWSEKWESVFGKIRRENREREHRSDSAFRYDTLTSDLLHQKDAGMSTELQDSLDATPVPAPVTLSKTETPETPLAYTVIPTKRPVLENGKSVQSKRMDQISATNRADAIRYDQCKPECDISNRRIVVTALAKKTASPSQFPVETTDFKSINQTSEIGAAVLNGAGVVLAQTIALPFTTLKLGRDAVSRVSDMN